MFKIQVEPQAEGFITKFEKPPSICFLQLLSHGKSTSGIGFIFCWNSYQGSCLLKGPLSSEEERKPWEWGGETARVTSDVIFVCTLELSLYIETFSWKLCATELRNTAQSSVTRWNFCFFTTATVASRCTSRKWFYCSWNLFRHGSSKKFHETDLVTWCNACWNLFCCAVVQKFLPNASTCNGDFIDNSYKPIKAREFSQLL